VYQTWRLLNEQDPQAAREFLTGRLDRLDRGPTSVYNALARAADFVTNNIDEHGFGPQDFSIWEEELAWTTFTQVTYASGLNAARLLAENRGQTASATKWLDGARRIRDAIRRPASAKPCPGLWNDTESRWNRSTRPDCTPDARLDASTDLVWVFGLIDSSDQRAGSQRRAVLSRLTPGQDDFGIARYEGDQFYFQSPFSPGGQLEATAETPSWPQMDMYMDMLEHWSGLDDSALERLQWYAKVTTVGYMPPGEAVDWPTDRPLPSTSSEPVTGAWYVLGLLNFLNLFDSRLPPLDTVPGSGPSPSADVMQVPSSRPANASATR
jgi:GH15 family glucan-1,4-alpha-glucosidase